MLLALTLGAATLPAQAQYTDPVRNKNSGNKSAFPKQDGGIFGKTQKFEGNLPLHLQADELVYDSEGNKVIARGNVEIQYEGNNLTADEVIYDQSANTLAASGNVVLRDTNGNIVRAERYTLTDDFRDGFVQSLSVLSRDNSRISAEQGVRRDGNVTEFSNAKFTPCPTDGSTPPLWCISARKVIHDEGAATISYQDAQFEMFGQPLFYMPYFEHPDPTVKRKSGFLAPGFGNSDDLGFFTEIPYYFALSPSYDFTFHPRFMTDQGILWMGDWRQRLATGQYTVKLAGIDQDGSNLDVSADKQESLDGFRGSLETRGDFSLSSWWRYGWNVTLESDDTFRRYYQLDNILLTDRVNNVYFTGMSERNYLATNFYHFGGLLSSDTPQSESAAYPVVDYNYVVADPVLGGELKLNGNLLAFSRSDGAENSDQQMSRAVAEVKWRRRFTDQVGITYTPFGELRGDLYQYDNYFDPETAQFVDNDHIARGLATGGVTVAYPWIANTAAASHVIEPIGQVIVRQASVDQRGLPVEDAKSLVFDDTNLFETSKFSGYDRLETGTRANVGLQYTFQPWSGGYARLLAGQSFHLSGDNPYENRTINCDGNIVVAPGVDDNCNPVFSPRSGLQNDRSDYVLGAYIAPTDMFRLISQNRFDEGSLTLMRSDTGLATNYGPFTLSATYAYTRLDPELDTAEQDISASFGLRLTDRWSLLGGMRYDIDDSEWLTSTAQVRYQDDCFMLSVSYNERNIADREAGLDPDRTIMFRVEFKHLGGFNYETDAIDHVFSDQQPPS
jgi:LPS-assembly protein